MSRPSILRFTEPAKILDLSDGTIQNELEERAPTLHRFLKAAVTTKTKGKIPKKGEPERSVKLVNGVGMAAAMLLKNRNPKMSAMAYKMSLLLWHGGVDKQVFLTFFVVKFMKLNHLIQ